jgi:hypothetical protein
VVVEFLKGFDLSKPGRAVPGDFFFHPLDSHDFIGLLVDALDDDAKGALTKSFDHLVLIHYNLRSNE